jgi:hypothetical protein
VADLGGTGPSGGCRRRRGLSLAKRRSVSVRCRMAPAPGGNTDGSREIVEGPPEQLIVAIAAVHERAAVRAGRPVERVVAPLAISVSLSNQTPLLPAVRVSSPSELVRLSAPRPPSSCASVVPITVRPVSSWSRARTFTRLTPALLQLTRWTERWLQPAPAVTGALLSITLKTFPAVSTLTSLVSLLAALKVNVAPLTLAVAPNPEPARPPPCVDRFLVAKRRYRSPGARASRATITGRRRSRSATRRSAAAPGRAPGCPAPSARSPARPSPGPRRR